MSPQWNAVDQRLVFEKVINQKNHGPIVLPAGFNDLIQLVKASAAIHHIIHHFEISKFHSVEELNKNQFLL